jgi:hypothetical protein
MASQLPASTGMVEERRKPDVLSCNQSAQTMTSTLGRTPLDAFWDRKL